MTPEQLMALGTAFAVYLRLFEACFVDRRTAEHLHSYCRGLLADLPRKSIEPIAAHLVPENVHPMSVPRPHDGEGAAERCSLLDQE